MTPPTPPTSENCRAAAAEIEITPGKPTFLYGYPHVPRTSRGVHDPLYASALCLGSGARQAVFVACDLIWVPRPLARRARERIAQHCALPLEAVMVTATHTHSGPVTNRMLSNEADPVVPPPDADYLHRLEQAIVEAGCVAAHPKRLQPVELRAAEVDGAFLGGNRRDPDGPAIPGVPVWGAFDGEGEAVACMAIGSMHPTVLHEDSPLISGDFPGLARQRTKARLGEHVPLVYHMGASGDQSPRHVVQHNTLDEAARLGHRLGDALVDGLAAAGPATPQPIGFASRTLDLPRRDLPAVSEAEARRDAAKRTLDTLREQGGDRVTLRTAEVDWFGAEETLTLARAAAEGRLADAAAQCLPAEVQVIELGERRLIGWPGEVFVDFALQVREHDSRARVITLANGDLQGYLVTQQAIDEGAYEAGNAIFASPEGGARLVSATCDLLRELDKAEDGGADPR